MRRLYSLWGILKLPVVTIFIAYFLMGLGDFFQNTAILPYISITNTTVLLICNIIRYIGAMLLKITPVLVLVETLAKRFEDSVPVYSGTIGYLVFLIITMFLSPTTLNSYAYNDLFSVTISAGALTTSTLVKYPLFTGFFGVMLIYWITKLFYSRSRRRFVYGFLSFINNDVWAMIAVVIWSVIAGVAVSFGWPYVLTGLESTFKFIASDIYNPMNMFLYGVAEQVLSVFDLQNTLHSGFWFSNLGGTWMDRFGKLYTGDISVWTALFSANTTAINYGRFITPLYIMNIFAMPAMGAAIYSLTTDKLKKNRYTMLLILFILLSVLTGSLWPMTIFLAVTAPGLFFIHTILISTLYAVLPMANIMLGYSYTGALSYALPGNLIDLIPYIFNPKYNLMVLELAIIGTGVFIIYYFITRIYYRYMSGDFLEKMKNNSFNNEVISALGGIRNIRMINSMVNNISVHLYDPSRMDNEALKELGAYRITNTRAGIEIEFGPRSSNLRQYILKELKKYLDSVRDVTQIETKEVSSKDLIKGQ